MSTKNHYRIPVDTSTALHACVFTPADTPQAIIVFSHGFTSSGTESRRIFVDIAERLLARNVQSVLFDYRGSGYSDLAFEDMTISTEIQDLQAVLDWLQNRGVSAPLFIWGASFGAAVASHVVAARNDVAGVVLWSLSGDLHTRYSKTLGEGIDHGGYTYLSKGFRVKKEAFLNALLGVDTHAAIARIAAPILLVHGTGDAVAPIDLSRRALSVAKAATLEEIPGGNHGFKLQPELFEDAVSRTLRWLDHRIR